MFTYYWTILVGSVWISAFVAIVFMLQSSCNCFSMTYRLENQLFIIFHVEVDHFFKHTWLLWCPYRILALVMLDMGPRASVVLCQCWWHCVLILDFRLHAWFWLSSCSHLLWLHDDDVFSCFWGYYIYFRSWSSGILEVSGLKFLCRMPVANLRASNTTDVVKSEEGNDSLDTIIKQAIGKEPLLSYTRNGDSSVQWIQLLQALDQPGTKICLLVDRLTTSQNKRTFLRP